MIPSHLKGVCITLQIGCLSQKLLLRDSKTEIRLLLLFGMCDQCPDQHIIRYANKFEPFSNFRCNIGYTSMFKKHNTRSIENSPTIQSKEFLLRCTLVWILKVSLCYQTEWNCNIAVKSSAMYSSPLLIHYLVLQSGRLLTPVYYNALSLQESLLQASKRRGSQNKTKQKLPGQIVLQ